ncbi:MAG: hypothetical protein ACK56F_21445, partial [bacterium]
MSASSIMCHCSRARGVAGVGRANLEPPAAHGHQDHRGGEHQEKILLRQRTGLADDHCVQCS